MKKLALILAALMLALVGLTALPSRAANGVERAQVAPAAAVDGTLAGKVQLAARDLAQELANGDVLGAQRAYDALAKLVASNGALSGLKADLAGVRDALRIKDLAGASKAMAGVTAKANALAPTATNVGNFVPGLRLAASDLVREVLFQDLPMMPRYHGLFVNAYAPNANAIRAKAPAAAAAIEANLAELKNDMADRNFTKAEIHVNGIVRAVEDVASAFK